MYTPWTGVSRGTGPYEEIFILSPSHSCMISFGAASCSLMMSSYRCCCLVSILLLFLSTQRGPCRRNCKVGTSTLSYYLLGARSKRSPEADQSLEQSKGTDAIRSGSDIRLNFLIQRQLARRTSPSLRRSY